MAQSHVEDCVDAKIVGSVRDKRATDRQYYCNEYKAGKTVLGLSPEKARNEPNSQRRQEGLKTWKTKKKLFNTQISVEGQKLKFDIDLYRSPETDSTKKPTRVVLPDQSKASIQLKTVLGHHLYQLQPSRGGKNLDIHLCSFFPGLRMQGQSDSATFKKKYFLFTASAKVTINPGSLIVDHFRVCSKFRFNPAQEASLTLLKVGTPEIFGVRRQGLKVDVKGNWLVNLADFYNKISNSKSIKDAIRDQVEDQDGKFVDSLLKNGKYLDSFSKPVQDFIKSKSSQIMAKANPQIDSLIESSIRSTCVESLTPYAQLGLNVKMTCANFVAKYQHSRAFQYNIEINNSKNKAIAHSRWRSFEKGSKNSSESLVLGIKNLDALLQREARKSLAP